MSGIPAENAGPAADAGGDSAARNAFIARFGGVFEHSPWIAAQAFDRAGGSVPMGAAPVHAALTAAFRDAPRGDRLGVLRAHPDLAGKLVRARRLTPESTAEQVSAGLDALSDAERATFSDLNARYVARFGFPFIIAVREHDKPSILAAFRRRLASSPEEEFDEACRQVERIAFHRLREMLPE